MKLKTALLATALFAASATAGAAEFYTYVPGVGTLDHNSFVSGQSQAVSVKFGATTFSGNGGLFNGYFYTGASQPADSYFRYFCIELGQNTNPNPIQYLSSVIVNDTVAKLFDVAFPRHGAYDFWNGGKTNFGLFANGTAAAAFQVALWNIFLDGDFSLSAGNFTWNSATDPNGVKAAAQNLLNQVSSYAGTGYQHWQLYRFVNPVTQRTDCTSTTCFQDFLSVRYVPEPGSLALFGLALAGLGLVGRRRRS